MRGIHKQLDKTSLMAWQNRMALDMLLAEKGGVCKMFGDACCTFIPNNTAPDGFITKALTSLSLELAENSGYSDPFSDLMGKWSGQWKDTITSVIIAIGIMLTILVLFGCCLIPCLRALFLRAIESAVEKRDIM